MKNLDIDIRNANNGKIPEDLTIDDAVRMMDLDEYNWEKYLAIKNQTKMSEEFCQHNGKYTLDKDNKCCKCRLPLKKGIKGIRLPLNQNKDE